MKNLIKRLEYTLETIKNDIINRKAYDYINEDWKTKEAIMEEHAEIVSEIENIDPDWYSEMYAWENWYASWCEVMLRTLLSDLKENDIKHK